ncbi:nucleotidyltransferase family protein [Pontibacter pamirensis]|uniref:nucleotidyltransferase family protein n=1 Tax=Pontibacter pamirensis TaxID=2562824 RepID=UPI001389D410|nr:nucleotidyltransferase domain-containing protein [Pontibacter pamirensis]
MNLIDSNIDKLVDLCKKHKVAKLFAFGSVVTDRFSKDSDIDLIVDFEEVDVNHYADNYFNFKFSLETLFKREVDLLEEKAIKNPFLRKSVDAKKKLVYG